nr:hypothetical protein Iba_chr09aCG11500 [Ipomoea batatas]GME10024.1 hypothetical protein Iba_scaffold9376CG0010 [Ipomoea batatas]
MREVTRLEIVVGQRTWQKMTEVVMMQLEVPMMAVVSGEVLDPSSGALPLLAFFSPQSEVVSCDLISFITKILAT